MEKQTNLAVWVVVALLVGALFTGLAMPSKVKTVVSPVTCPTLPSIPACPQPVVSDLETAWKTEAIGIATAEWSDKAYKPLFEVLRHIDDKKDISSVVVKSFKVTESDSFSKDAVVYQELKVYYEDDKGDDKKAFVDVETTIKDGELDEQVISLH